ncbi:GnsA/GnsB family addiction module toxin [Escherichia coli]
MNIEELKNKPNGNRRLYRAKNRRAEQEYRERSLEIRFTAREKMTGLESYDVKIKIM